MIVGVGTDLVQISRIGRLVNRFGPRFLEKCFTPEENEYALARKTPAKQMAAFAKLYAAKEAVLKATGLGMREGMRWHDIAVRRDGLGKPVVTVRGRVAESINDRLNDGFTHRLDISLSDEGDYALAFVVVSAYKE